MIQKWFVEHQKTLSIAESCTGGKIISSLVEESGASRYLLGGVVAYSNQAKIDLVSVPKTLIEKYGAVSEQVVIAMAKGALKAFKSDFSIATTGIAGPEGGSKEKPVGLVWMAVVDREGREKVWSIQALGDRKAIIKQAVKEALDGLYMFLQKK